MAKHAQWSPGGYWRNNSSWLGSEHALWRLASKGEEGWGLDRPGSLRLTQAQLPSNQAPAGAGTILDDRQESLCDTFQKLVKLGPQGRGL